MDSLGDGAQAYQNRISPQANVPSAVIDSPPKMLGPTICFFKSSCGEADHGIAKLEVMRNKLSEAGRLLTYIVVYEDGREVLVGVVGDAACGDALHKLRGGKLAKAQ